jgi:hypothetical protein
MLARRSRKTTNKNSCNIPWSRYNRGMNTLFTFLYVLLLIILSISALFVVYHVLRYSLNTAFGIVGVIVFGIVFVSLATMNIVSFRALDLQAIFGVTSPSNLLPNTPLSPQSPQRPVKSQKTPW